MAVWVCCAIPPPVGAWSGALLFTLLIIASEFAPVSTTKSMEVTIAAPIHWTVAALFGPAAALVIAVAPMLFVNLTGWLCARVISENTWGLPNSFLRGVISALAGFWQGRRVYRLSRALQIIGGNAALDAITVGSAALAYRAAGGSANPVELLLSGSASAIILRVIVPFCVCVTTYFFVDEARYVTTRILIENRPEDTKDWYGFVLRFRILLLESVRLTYSQYLVLPPVSLLMIYLYAHIGLLSGFVVLGPVLSLRLSVQKAVERQQVFMDTVATLGTYMQHYHPYTRGHLKRVADLSERLARELRLPAERIVLMPYAGLLHDIGKVGVSEQILDKVGALSDDEWAKIKEHPSKGADIVQHLEFLDQTVEWIKYHHKWANGSGYPENGVKNGSVPIEAAIIAVADAFDAMTDDRELSMEWVCDSCDYRPENGGKPQVCPRCGATKKRVYRAPLSLEGAINELRRGAGTQFSPEVVKAFLRLVDREEVSVGGSG